MQKYVLIDYQGLDLYVDLEWGSIHTLKAHNRETNRWTYNDVTDCFTDATIQHIIEKAEQEFAEIEWDAKQGPHEYERY